MQFFKPSTDFCNYKPIDNTGKLFTAQPAAKIEKKNKEIIDKKDQPPTERPHLQGFSRAETMNATYLSLIPSSSTCVKNICAGEAYTHMKELLVRPYLSLNANDGTGQLVQASKGIVLYPDHPSLGVGETVSTPAKTFTMCFAYWKGSVGVKVVAASAESTVFVMAQLVNSQSITKSTRYSLAATVPTTQNLFNYCQTNVAYFPAISQYLKEVLLPYYNILPFLPTTCSNYMSSSPEGSQLVLYNGAGGDIFVLEFCGEDYQLGYFIGVPIMAMLTAAIA